MTADELKEALKQKRRVKFDGGEGYVVDTYTAAGGEPVAIVSGKPGPVAFGCNVPISKLSFKE